MKRKHLIETGLIIAIMLIASTSFALSYTFSGVGNNDGEPTAATADINITGTAMTITLANTTVGADALGSVLDGFKWTFNSSMTVTLNSVTAVGGVWNASSGSWVSVSGPYPANFGWLISPTTGSAFTMAPSGYHPYGIIDKDITDIEDGIKNAQHNPFLDGPVTFNLTLGGSNPEITGVTFIFGTNAYNVPGHQVPEPLTLILLGLGMVGLAGVKRFKK